jgi:hypothetical protein
MECLLTDEAIETGENHVGVFDFDVLVSLYGDIDMSAFDADQLVDYDAATQGDSLAELFTD